MRTSRTMQAMLCSAGIAASLALAGPAMAQQSAPAVAAKSVTMVGQVEMLNQRDGEGTVRGSLGRGTVTTRTTPPNVDITFKLKGGTLSLRGSLKPAGNSVSGTWKVVKGTGKYRGAKGGGRMTGKFSFPNGTLTFKGSVAS